MQITRFSREEFLTERWNYQPGEHVSLITATQNGKTTMIFDLLKHTDTSWCNVPPVMLVSKPQDRVVSEGLEHLGYDEIDKWPPRKKLFSDPPNGYGLWPKHIKDVEEEVNDAHIAASLKPAQRELFWRGNTICVADEIYALCAVLGMSRQMTRHWIQGHGMGSGLWSATQKPSGTQQGTVPSFMYNSPTHTFLGKEPDENNRKRFGEIGGVDPKLVSRNVLQLAQFEWLYIHRNGPTMCIIEA
jgi:hypothetical protein